MARHFHFPGRSPVHAAGGMACTSHPLATSAALHVLQSGGNAVDAAITSAAVQAVVEPAMTGIGGDCFAIVCEPDGQLHALNGSGRTAVDLNAGALHSPAGGKLEQRSPHAITVPTALRAWSTLSAQFGSFDWADLLAPAIAYAAEGFPVTQRVAADWRANRDFLAGNPAAAQLFLTDGEAPQMGTRYRMPALAATLRAVAADGVSAFYEGAIADDMILAIRSEGSAMQPTDFAAAEADWVTPVSASYRGREIFELPPNGQGITALILLNILEHFEISAFHPDSAERYHLELEAARLAYAVRDAVIADPADMTSQVDRLISKEFGAQLAAQLDPDHRNDAIAVPSTAQSDTIYLTVVDKDRRAVSFINSLFSGFGSGIASLETGVLFQNRGCGFTLQPDHPNSIGPAKRPLHTIIPAFAFQAGRPWLSFGVMGGSYQALGHAHVLVDMIDYGSDPQAALDRPRVFWTDDGTQIRAEDSVPDAVVDGLRRRGHIVVRSALPIGGGQIIEIDQLNGLLCGGSDPRKDGHSAGY